MAMLPPDAVSGQVVAASWGDAVRAWMLERQPTATGQILYSPSVGNMVLLPIGSTGQVLTVQGSLPAWADGAAGVEIFEGLSQPNNAQGKPQDLYFRTGVGVYIKAANNTWPQQVSIATGLNSAQVDNIIAAHHITLSPSAQRGPATEGQYNQGTRLTQGFGTWYIQRTGSPGNYSYQWRQAVEAVSGSTFRIGDTTYTITGGGGGLTPQQVQDLIDQSQMAQTFVSLADVDVTISAGTANHILVVAGTGDEIHTVDGLDAAYIDSGVLAVARIPGLPGDRITSGMVPVARLGGGTPSGTTFLRGDGHWATPPGGGGSDGVVDSATLEFNDANSVLALTLGRTIGDDVVGAVDLSALAGGGGGNAATWAQAGNTDDIPADKISNAFTRDAELLAALNNLGLGLTGQDISLLRDGSGSDSVTLPAGGGGGLDQDQVDARIARHVINLAPGANLPAATQAHYNHGVKLTQGPLDYYVQRHGTPQTPPVWGDLTSGDLAGWAADHLVERGADLAGIPSPAQDDWAYVVDNSRWYRYVGLWALSNAPADFDSHYLSEKRRRAGRPQHRRGVHLRQHSPAPCAASTWPACPARSRSSGWRSRAAAVVAAGTTPTTGPPRATPTASPRTRWWRRWWTTPRST